MVQMATGLEEEEEGEKLPLITLGNLSVLLLLNLACHHPARGTNPFKEALAAFQNSQGRALKYTLIHEQKFENQK